MGSAFCADETLHFESGVCCNQAAGAPNIFPASGALDRYRLRGIDRSRSAPVRCLVSRMIWPWCNCRWPVTR